MSEKNSIDLEDPRSIIGTRVFDAPRDLMFSAWTDPKHLAQWWGPNGFTTITTSAFEFRPGGVWRFIMHGPDGRPGLPGAGHFPRRKNVPASLRNTAPTRA